MKLRSGTRKFDFKKISILRKSIVSSQRGQAIIEMVLLTPVLLGIILGITEVGGAITSYISVTDAAREGARLAARGNVFSPTDLRFVVESHSTSIDIASHGTIVVTSLKSDKLGTITFNSQTLVGTEASHFSQASLTSSFNSAIAANPSHLVVDQFVLVEVMYNHPTVTGFFGFTIPIYAYVLMPVSALS